MTNGKAARPADASPDASSRKRLRKEEGNAGSSPISVIDGAESTRINHYEGFVVPEQNYELERINVNDITPELFFEKYVATRKPVVLRGFIQDAAFTAPNKWTNKYLEKLAGEEILAVERRETTKEKFGRGIEVPMKFKELLHLINKGDELHYLTTQDVEAEDDGRPAVMAPFIAKLQSDFPLRPALLGNLVPQNINIWMGNNTHGSSSGLHHDYHDNLYILLRGKKRFRLYSPVDAEKMYTRGKLVHVHPNGRINYKGEETTAYGADPMSEAAALASIEKDDAEKELALAEQAMENGEEGAEHRLAAAEERLDKAILGVLRVEREDEDGLSEPEDGEFGPFHFDEDGDDDDDVDEEGDDVGDQDVEDEFEDFDEEDALSKSRKVDKTVKDPVSFSRIDTYLLKDSASEKQLHAEFPEFKDAKVAFCEIEAGEMLFLPASWFHEVESFGSVNGHLALNYWYHPPDQLNSFEMPYSSPFWPRDWQMRFASADDTQN